MPHFPEIIDIQFWFHILFPVECYEGDLEKTYPHIIPVFIHLGCQGKYIHKESLPHFSITNFRLNNLTQHYILEEFNFNFRQVRAPVRLYDLDILREKWLNYLQTVETLIRCHRMWHMIWVCTVFQLSFWVSGSK